MIPKILALWCVAISPLLANFPSQQSVLLDAGVSSLTVNNTGTGGSSPYVIGCGLSGSDRCAVTVTATRVFPNLVLTTAATSITAGSRTVTPASMTGIQIGLQAEIDTGASHERVKVTAVTETTFTGTFVNSHSGTYAVAGTYYAPCSGACSLSLNRNFGQAYFITEIVNSAGVSYSPRRFSDFQVIPQIAPSAFAAGSWTFPIEVIGQDNYALSVQASIPSGVVTTGLRLMLIGVNLGYQAQTPVDGKCSAKVNSAAWQDINDANVTAIDEAKYYGGIGSAPPVRNFTLPVTNGTITASSTATFGFRFNGTDGVTSGCRILNLNLIEPSVQISSISVASNVATVTTSAAHGYTTGNWVYVYNAPGPWGRFNGDRQITVTNSTHFTFTPCTTVDMLSCTSPNGTFTVPTSQNPTAPEATQPVAYVAREIISASAFAQEDPSAWSAPVGSNATNGQSLWNTAPLVISRYEYGNNITVATCGNCHFADGRDLKELNYSNWAIKQRAVFHGLTEQNGDDIAAYIRGLSAASIPMGRPYNPIYQPGPGLDSGVVQRWIGGAGWKSVNVYDNDSALSTVDSTWAPTGSINMRELALHTLLPDWNHWLPAIWMGDFFPNFTSSALLMYYNNAASNITAGSVASYGAYDNYMEGFFETQFNTGWYATVNFQGLEALAGYHRPSLYTLALFSAKLWMFVKQAEIIRSKGFEGSLDTIYTNLYGASTNGYFSRGWYGQVPFQSAPHFQRSLSRYGLLDETVETWNYLSYCSYQLALILNTGNRRGFSQFPSDWAYQHGFLANLGKMRPAGYLDTEVLLIGPQAGYDFTTITPDFAGLNVLRTYPRMGSMGDSQDQKGQQFLTTAQRVTIYTQLVTNWLDVYAKYPLAQWQAEAGTCCAPLDAWFGGGGLLDSISLALPVLKTIGVNNTLLTNWAAAAHTIYPARDFATTDLGASCTWTAPATELPRCTNTFP